MQIFGLVGLAIAVALGVWIFFGPNSAMAPASYSEPAEVSADVQAHIDSKSDLIRLDTPVPNDTISSTLTITGEARGYWFFEASFPIVLIDWDGRVIAEHYATADGDWMTEDFVPFTAELEFENPYQNGDPDFMRRGTLIFKRDNPSDLPENDDALEIPVLFTTPETSTYQDSLDAAKRAAEQLQGGAVSLSSKSVMVADGVSVPDDTRVLDLSGRGLSGSLKAEIRELRSLEVLDISNNNFTGLPAEIGQLSQLRVLNVSHNPITGLPYEISNLSKLEQFDLEGTNYAEADLAIIKASLPADTVVFVD